MITTGLGGGEACMITAGLVAVRPGAGLHFGKIANFASFVIAPQVFSRQNW